MRPLFTVALAASLAASNTVLGATATGALSVSMIVPSTCMFSFVTTVDFGARNSLASAIVTSAPLYIQCSKVGVAYSIALDAGLGAGATTASRKMTNAKGDAASYTLYKDPAQTEVWGDTGASVVSSTSSGGTTIYYVYARTAASVTPPPGKYTDTIRATLTF